MSARLVFLGTKGDIEESEWNHEKHASILIEYRGKRYVFDWGEAFTKGDWERIKPDYVILTHAHRDHIGGLAKLKPEHFKGVRFVTHSTCYNGPKDMKEGYSVVKLLGENPPGRWRIFDRILKKWHQVGDLLIMPVPCWHSVKAPSVVYVIKVAGRKIVYAPDVLHINKQEIVHLRDADLYIGDGSSLDHDLVRKPKGYKHEQVRIGHASIKTQLKWLRDLNIKTAIFTHWGEWALKLTERELRSTLNKLGKEYGIKVYAAQDGTQVDLTTMKVKLATEVPAIYLVEPHGELIWKGEKTLIVKSRKFNVKGKTYYLVSGKKCYGIITFTHVRGPYAADHIRKALRDKHRITDEEWQKWWPSTDKVYIYAFEFQPFDEPVEVEVPHGAQTFFTLKLPEKLELDPETFDPSSLTDEQLVHYWAKCAAWLNRAREGKFKWDEETVLDIATRVAREMIKRGIHPSPDTELYKAIAHKLEADYEQVEFELAPVRSFRPASEQGELITLDDLLKHIRPFYLKRPFILLVGGLAVHGKTRGDIDILVMFPRRVAERDLPLEFRIGRMLPPELSSRLQFMYGEFGGPFTSYVPLYDLLVVPHKPFELVKMELEDLLLAGTRIALDKIKEKAAEEALISRSRDEIKLFRFFLPAKPTIGHEPAEAYRVDNLIDVIGEERIKKGLIVEKKYDGNRLIIHKDGKKVKVYTEQGLDVTKRLPGLVAEIASWKHPKRCILDTDTERWTADGEYIGREEVAAYLHSKTKADDTGIVANVFDVLYWWDDEMKHHALNMQIGDLHKEPLRVRLKYRDLLPIKQSTADAPDISTHFNVAPYIEVHSVEELKRAVKKLAHAKASEGVVVKALDSKYPLNGHCRGWWKYKKTATIHAIVLKKLPTKKAGIYRYYVGLRIPPGWECDDEHELNGKKYVNIGKVMNTKFNLKPGTIVEVDFEELFHYEEEGKHKLKIYVAQIHGVRKEQTEPDTAKEAIEIARRAGLLRKKMPGVKLAYPLDDKARRYVIQWHWRGEGAHLDLRWERTPGSQILDGFTIAAVKKGAAGGRDVESLSRAKQLSNWSNLKISNEPSSIRVFAEEKAPEPRPWLTYEGVVKPGTVGATKHEPGVFVKWDYGKVWLGRFDDEFKEFFFDGKELKGRWIARLIPRRKPAHAKSAFLWLFGKPKDQTPFVLSRRAVKEEWIPPHGVSALPPWIREQIPPEYQYWKHRSKKKRLEVRAALVEAIKKGEVKIKLAKRAKYVLQWHFWKKRTLIRSGPSAQHYDLRIQIPGRKSLMHFVLHKNPLTHDEVAAELKDCPDPSWMKRGLKKREEIEPGKPGNPTKDTPAYIEVIDKGTCTVVTKEDTFIRIMFHSGKMKGLWVASRSSPNDPIWLFRRTELPQPSST